MKKCHSFCLDCIALCTACVQLRVIKYDPILVSEEEIISLRTDWGFEVEVVTRKGRYTKGLVPLKFK